MEEILTIPQGGVISTDVTSARFILRQGDVDEWTTAEYAAPSQGEPIVGWKNGKPILKIGNGNDKWDELPGLGAQDAISLSSEEENKEFSFTADTTTVNHSTPTPDGLATAAGMIYNAGQSGSASFGNNDHMIVRGKSTFAAGRNIKVNANYASALGSHHINEGYGAFAAGTGNILTTLKNNNGKTKNSQYATAFGQQVGTIGAASFSAGTGDSAISNFVQNLTANNSKEEVYNEWIALNRGKRPSISWGDWSARFGSYNISIGNNSFVTGGYNAAVGDYSAAFGENTFVLHDHSFVCGSNNLIDWKESFAAGGNNKVYDQRSFVVGGNNIAGIEGRCAEKEKEDEEQNIPEGERAIIGYNTVFGQNNSALSTHGFISGYNNTIAGAGAAHSGIVGMGNYIGGSGGYYSFVAGLNNVSHNNGAAVLGAGLISSTNYGLTVGKLNKEVSNALFVVGNGIGDVQGCTINRETHKINYNGATPSNAFVVYTDGHAEVGAPSTNDLAVATYGQIKTIFDIKTKQTSGKNAENPSFIYAAEWTEIYNNDRIIQATALFTITNSLAENAGPIGLYTFTCPELLQYSTLSKAILTYNGSTQSEEACNCCYVYRTIGDESIPIIRFWHELGSLDIDPGHSIKLTLQLSL